MPADTTARLHTQCCIVGGGPAGMMLGYLLARSNIRVIVLEKHADFLRDFRGDTVHPSTLQVLGEIGLLRAFERLPQRRVEHLGVNIGGAYQPAIDFRGLKPFGYLALVPQWDFLNLLAAEARSLPAFELRMQHEALDLIESDEGVNGVLVASPDGPLHICADLVVACDGRDSRMRQAAALHAEDFGAPMDALWFRVRREANASDNTFATIGRGHILVLLNREEYWQAAYVVPKGDDQLLRAAPLSGFTDAVAAMAPFLNPALAELRSWDDVKTLTVQVNRLTQWYRPGLLCIGDAAHAMSPVGGVGINLAIQDAVAAANTLQAVLASGSRPAVEQLRQVQRRREAPTRVMQFLQLQIQKRVIAPALNSTTAPTRLPSVLRWLLQFRRVRNLPARLVGYGIDANGCFDSAPPDQQRDRKCSVPLVRGRATI